MKNRVIISIRTKSNKSQFVELRKLYSISKNTTVILSIWKTKELSSSTDFLKIGFLRGNVCRENANPLNRCKRYDKKKKQKLFEKLWGMPNVCQEWTGYYSKGNVSEIPKRLWKEPDKGCSLWLLCSRKFPDGFRYRYCGDCSGRAHRIAAGTTENLGHLFWSGIGIRDDYFAHGYSIWWIRKIQEWFAVL